MKNKLQFKNRIIQVVLLVAMLFGFSASAYAVKMHVSAAKAHAVYGWDGSCSGSINSWPGIATTSENTPVVVDFCGNMIINNNDGGKQCGDITSLSVDTWYWYDGGTTATTLMTASNMSSKTIAFASDGMSGWSTTIDATWDGTNNVFTLSNQAFSNSNGVDVYIGGTKYAYFAGNSHSSGTYNISWNPNAETVTFASACTQPTVTATGATSITTTTAILQGTISGGEDITTKSFSCSGGTVGNVYQDGTVWKAEVTGLSALTDYTYTFSVDNKCGTTTSTSQSFKTANPFAGKTIYLDASKQSGAEDNNAWFSMHAWTGGNNSDYKMYSFDRETKIYYVTLPNDFAYENLCFNRKNPTNSSDDWGHTSDLTVKDAGDNNKYDFYYSGGSDAWGTYNATGNEVPSLYLKGPIIYGSWNTNYKNDIWTTAVKSGDNYVYTKVFSSNTGGDQGQFIACLSAYESNDTKLTRTKFDSRTLGTNVIITNDNFKYNTSFTNSESMTIKVTRSGMTNTFTIECFPTTYALVGEFNNWNASANPFTTTGTSRTATITLPRGTTYQPTQEKSTGGFKILDIGGQYYGNKGTMTSENCSNWTMSTSNETPNCGITTQYAGTYTFTFNTTNNKLSVTYPTGYTITGAVNDANMGSISPASFTGGTGETQKFTATPNTGYRVQKWEDGGQVVPEQTETTYTSIVGSAAKTVKVYFESICTPPTSLPVTGQLNSAAGSPWAGTEDNPANGGVFGVGHNTATLKTTTDTEVYEWYTCDASGNPAENTNVTLSNQTTKTATATFKLPGQYYFRLKAKCTSDVTYVQSDVLTVNVPFPTLRIEGPMIDGGYYNCFGLNEDPAKGAQMDIYGTKWYKQFTVVGDIGYNNYCFRVGEQYLTSNSTSCTVTCPAGWCTDNNILSRSSVTSGNLSKDGDHYVPDASLAIKRGDVVKVEVTMNDITASGTGAFSVSIIKVCSKPTITASNPTAICGSGKPAMTASTDAGTIYWYSDAECTSQIATGESYTPSEAISTTTNYYLKAKSGSYNECESDVKTLTATVNALPKASISGGTAVCQNGSLTLTGSGAGVNGSYKWNSGDYTTTDTYVVVTTDAGAQEISLKVKDANGCESASAASQSVTVREGTRITSDPSSDAASYCIGNTITPLTVNAVGYGTLTYKWQYCATVGGAYSDVSTGTGYTTNSFTPANNVASSYYYKCVVSGDCGTVTSAASGLITVNALPTLTSLEGPDILCAATGPAGTYTTDNIDGATYYWSGTGGGLTGFTATYQTNVTTGDVTTDNASISVYAINSGCTGNTLTKSSISVVAKGIVPGTVQGEGTVCANATGVTYTSNATGATSYNWTVPAGWTITAGQGESSITVHVGSAGGDVSVSLSNTCGSAAIASLSVTVKSLTRNDITGAANVCPGVSTTYTSTATGATTYSWEVPSGWNITAGTGESQITVTPSSTGGAVKVSLNNGCLPSAEVVTKEVTSTNITAGTITTSVDNVCPGAQGTMTVDNPSQANSIQWLNSEQQEIAGATGNTYSPVVDATSTFYAKFGKTNGLVTCYATSDAGTIHVKSATVTQYPATDINPYEETTFTASESATWTLLPGKIGFLLPQGGAAAYRAENVCSVNQQPDKNAYEWFNTNYVQTGKGEFIEMSALDNVPDAEKYSVIWVDVDRANCQGLGDVDLSVARIQNLGTYVKNGGNLYLSKRAVQALRDMSPARFNHSGDDGGKWSWGYYNADTGETGGYVENNDIWTINPHVGRNVTEFDRSSHSIYKYCTWNTTSYTYPTIQLVNKTNECNLRTDNNTMWLQMFDASGNPLGVDEASDLTTFESAWSCKVLAVWGHVTDYAGPGLMEWLPTSTYKGTIISNGFAAYNWDTSNPDIANVQNLTKGILEYLDAEAYLSRSTGETTTFKGAEGSYVVRAVVNGCTVDTELTVEPDPDNCH